MPQTYTNKDLVQLPTGYNKSKSHIYNNSDLIDSKNDFEPDEELIDFDASPVNEELVDFDNESTPETDTFSDKLIKGAKGFAKGTILDLPESFMGAAMDIHDRFNPITVAKNIINPIDAFRKDYTNIKNQASDIVNTTQNAGEKPEEFGRMMGHLVGQPLLTAGVVKGFKPAVRTAGRVMEPVGRVMKRYAPLTGMPVVSPFAGRNLMRLERGAGRMIESAGKSMKSVGKGKSNATPKLEMPLEEGESIAPPKTFKVINNEEVKPSVIKPKVRPNGDGTFTNVNTGEVLDGQMRPIIEYNGKPISKDSPFFFKNRK